MGSRNEGAVPKSRIADPGSKIESGRYLLGLLPRSVVVYLTGCGAILTSIPL